MVTDRGRGETLRDTQGSGPNIMSGCHEHPDTQNLQLKAWSIKYKLLNVIINISS